VSNNIQTITRTAFAAIAISVAAMSLPAFAAGSEDDSLLVKKEYKCQSIEKAAKTLRKYNYKHIEYQGNDKAECVYIFSADKKRDGEYWSWIVYYDAYDREIIGREPQKKEVEEM